MNSQRFFIKFLKKKGEEILIHNVENFLFLEEQNKDKEDFMFQKFFT